MQWEAIKHDHSKITQCNCSLQCRPINSAGASLNEPPPELQQLALNFLSTFLVVSLLNNDCLLVATVHEIHLYGPTLSSLTLPLCQQTYRCFGAVSLTGLVQRTFKQSPFFLDVRSNYLITCLWLAKLALLAARTLNSLYTIHWSSAIHSAVFTSDSRPKARCSCW